MAFSRHPPSRLQKSVCMPATPSAMSPAYPHRQPACAAAKNVFVLDFDGVLIDSEPEVSASAMKAAKSHWPSLFSQLTASQHKQLMHGMKQVRPVLVRGYESMVMLRILLEDPHAVDEILSNWSQLLPDKLSQYEEDSEELNAVFERIRGEWMKADIEGWMKIQQPYEGVTAALKRCAQPMYIASSKAGHRVSALAKLVLDFDVPEDSPRLFSSLLPPEEKKTEVLRLINNQHGRDPDVQFHFVDDRLDTLLAVRSCSELDHWNLHFADWGYSTPKEREEALRLAEVNSLSCTEFVHMLSSSATATAAVAAG